MAIGYPTNIVILIVATMAATGIAVWLIFSQTLRKFSPQVSRAWSWAAAIVLAAWFIGRLALSIFPPNGTMLDTMYLISFLVVGILVGVLPLALSPTFRQVVRSIPETWLVGVHAIRVLGVLFLALLDMKLLPPEFALSAGYGDITVGVLALVMVYLLATRKPYARALVIGWNLLGLLDFVGALVTGLFFIGPYAAQLASHGVSLLYLNYVFFIPSFGVPLYTVLHMYSLRQMFTARSNQKEREPETPVHAAAFSGR